MFDADLKAGPISAQQLAQARDLTRARRADQAHLEEYCDPCQERLAALIDPKVANEEVGEIAEVRQQFAGKLKILSPSGQQQAMRRPATDTLAGGERIGSQRPLRRRILG